MAFYDMALKGELVVEATHNSKLRWRGILTEQLEIFGSSLAECK